MSVFQELSDVWEHAFSRLQEYYYGFFKYLGSQISLVIIIHMSAVFWCVIAFCMLQYILTFN